MGLLILYLIGVLILCVAGIIFISKLSRKQNSSTKNIKLKRRKDPYLFLLPTLILLVFMFGYPLINSFIMSFQHYNLSTPGNIYFNGFDNFKKLFSDSDIWLIIRNSFFYVIASVTGQVLLGLILALTLKKPFPFRGLYHAIVFLPWAFSAFVIGLIQRWSFNGEYGIINNSLAWNGWAIIACRNHCDDMDRNTVLRYNDIGLHAVNPGRCF